MSAANSKFDTAAIEAIVREVLRRLTDENVASHSTAPGIAADNQPVSFDSATFTSDEKIITLETLRGKLDNISTLRLKQKTIVTPAARDELRDRKIEIKFDAESHKVSTTSQNLLVGATCLASGTKLQEQLKTLGVQVQLHTDDRTSRLATAIGNQVSTSMRAIIVTDQPYTAACVANRNANVRAVNIRDEADLLAAKSEINPNCIVLHTDSIKRINISLITSTFLT